MKFFKRLAPIVLVLILVLAMVPTGAFACSGLCTSFTVQMKDSNGAIQTTSGFTAYRVVAWGFNYDTSDNVSSYKDVTIKSADYRTAIAAADGLTAVGSYTDFQLVAMLSSIYSDADKSAALAAALKAAVGTAPADTIKTSTSGQFSGLLPGYYIIIQTSGVGSVLAKPILVALPAIGAKANSCTLPIAVKTSTANIEKKIVETDGANTILVDSSTAAVGDTVNYQTTSTFPTYPSATTTGIVYTVTDSFSAGLTPVNNLTAKIVTSAAGSTQVGSDLVLGTDYTLTAIGNTFELTLLKSDAIKGWGNAGNLLVLNYSATVNENAKYGAQGNPNSVKLTFGAGSSVDSTGWDTVITYTTKLVITKTDNTAEKAPLAGAVFTLQKLVSGTIASPVWSTPGVDATTDISGKATFDKLEQGTYRLTEKTAPAGFKKLDTQIVFVVGAKNYGTSIPNKSINQTNAGNDLAYQNFMATWSVTNSTAVLAGADGILTAAIVNEPDYHLPGTGGIGTTIFTVSGIIILLLASILFVVYNKKRREGENH